MTEVSNPSGVIPGSFQTVTYTAFHQPATINEGIYNLAFTYGADDQRRKTVLKQSGNTIETRYFFGAYEKRVAGGNTQYIHYIGNGQNLVAVVVREGGTDTYHYTYTDHLGSILTVTNSAGTVTSEQNFDAWGRSRHPSTWTYTGVPTPPVWLYRGFTGHEHLPQFNLLNMNGRLYDPLLARMLSVDNYVQMPGYTQNYNRYSYVLNNPLRFTDPSGEWVHIVAGAVVGGLINGIVHASHPNGGFWKGFAIGAVAGAVTAATGGAVVGALGLPSTGIISGLVSGASGAIIGSPVQGIGNAIVFGDAYSPERWGKDILIGGLAGGIVGGGGALLQNARGTPTNIFWGTNPAPGRGVWSLQNTPDYSKAVALLHESAGGAGFPQPN